MIALARFGIGLLIVVALILIWMLAVGMGEVIGNGLADWLTNVQ